MIDEQTLGKITEGDSATLGQIEKRLSCRALALPEIIRVWEAVIEGVQNGGPNAAALVNFGRDKLSSASQDPEVGKMYENVLSAQAYPKVSVAYVFVIGIGAALARMSQGEAPERLNKATYLRLAKAALLNVVANGNDDAKKYAAEGLRFIKDMDVWNELVTLAKGSSDTPLRAAAGESAGYIRVENEIAAARADRALLLEAFPDPTAPQGMYIECIFTAVEKVLGRKPVSKEEQMEASIAVKQLSSFGANPGLLAGLFDQESLSRIQSNVENALLHVLTSGYPKAAVDEAASGLERIGSERVEGILDRIVARVGEQSEAGAAASDALAGVRGRLAVEVIETKLIPPPPMALGKRAKPPPVPKQRLSQ